MKSKLDKSPLDYTYSELMFMPTMQFELWKKAMKELAEELKNDERKNSVI